MSATVVCCGSKVTVARSVARLTAARSTPAILPIAFSTRLTQEAQVIPLTGKLTSPVLDRGEETVGVMTARLLGQQEYTPDRYMNPRLKHSRRVKAHPGQINEQARRSEGNRSQLTNIPIEGMMSIMRDI